MIKFGGYSFGIAQIDDETVEKLNFRVCPNSTVSLLVSRSDMPNLRCFSIGGMKNQPDPLLKSFGTTEEIIISLSRLPSTTYSLLPSSLLLQKFWTFLFFLLFSIFENILRQILTEPQNAHQKNL